MACETFTTTIEDKQYSYTQLSAKKSLKLKFRLAGIIGEALADLVAAMSVKEEDKQIKSVGAALQSIFGNHEPDVIVSLIESVLIPAFVDGERIDIDRDFTGNLQTLYKVIAWVLSKEYGDFFGGALSLLKK